MSVVKSAWLAVGLGNPGKRYERTRHNAGARAVEHLADRLGVKLRSTRAVALMGQGLVEEERLLLARPTTFMNESGRAVDMLSRMKAVPAERLVILHDEIDLPVGSLKMKRGGGSAGHHGIESVVRSLGTADFYRVRIGVGRPASALQEPADFLLEPMASRDAQLLALLEEKAGEAVLALIRLGLEEAMNRFNTVAN